MKFLLTNDDGFDAPGLAALREAVAGLGELVVVAPAEPQSGCSHQVTTGRPFRVRRHDDVYVVEGTPADCVRVGLFHLAEGADWVLAGVNAGGNLGADVYVSGTVAAVREAALLGRPGVAVSHYRRRGEPFDWPRVVPWVRTVLADLLRRPTAPGGFWNVNLPHLAPDADAPTAVECPLDPGPLPVRFRREEELFHYDGDYHQRPRAAGSDVDVCFGGRIAVTRLGLGAPAVGPGPANGAG
jgi:5'-nucleotidase